MKTFFSRLSLILSLAILLTACVRAAATNPPPPAPQQEILDVLSQKNPDMTLHGQATGPLVKCDTIPVAKTPLVVTPNTRNSSSKIATSRLLRESLTSVASGCNTRVGILFYRSRLEFEIEPK